MLTLPVTHVLRHRVAYAETDRMGVVHHAEYLVWFERGRVELLRSLGVSYRELEQRGVMLPVREARVKFLRRLGFDDEVEVTTSLVEVNRATCLFHSDVRQVPDEVLCAEGDILLAFCDSQGRLLRNGPAQMQALIEESKTKRVSNR